MKTLLIACLLLAACGSSGNGGASAVVTNPTPTSVTYTLDATLTFPGDTQHNAFTATTAATTTVTVPTTLAGQMNGSEPCRATLYIGTLQVYYSQVAGVYSIYGSTGGLVAGSTVVLTTGQLVTLELQTGYASQFTKVEAVVSGITQ